MAMSEAGAKVRRAMGGHQGKETHGALRFSKNPRGSVRNYTSHREYGGMYLHATKQEATPPTCLWACEMSVERKKFLGLGGERGIRKGVFPHRRGSEKVVEIE